MVQTEPSHNMILFLFPKEKIKEHYFVILIFHVEIKQMEGNRYKYHLFLVNDGT